MDLTVLSVYLFCAPLNPVTKHFHLRLNWWLRHPGQGSENCTQQSQVNTGGTARFIHYGKQRTQPWGEVEWQEGNEAVCLLGSHFGESAVGVPQLQQGSLLQGRGMRIKNSRQEEQGY